MILTPNSAARKIRAHLNIGNGIYIDCRYYDVRVHDGVLQVSDFNSWFDVKDGAEFRGSHGQTLFTYEIEKAETVPASANITSTFKIMKTRYAGLGYWHQGHGLWRVVDIHDSVLNPQGMPRTVGPMYKSKAELMGDLDRYARESWGY